ncbi:hypothetical protein [Pseudomonas sp. OIL-1]|uniref:type IV toxin-antitoxin system AbiEi family antitoxin domain-containing protein n=1 Tax=Pseudomonas sp. OIL-1 TaxID=2706126 RepID=UPI0013A72B46|nr:hypothetical protein [Pseudomonas sp. OIL-1]QIB52628.1 hypothetical protein G3M63_17195 [Pseudomonas sp. OIL-1]
MNKQIRSLGSIPFNHGTLLSYLGGYRRPNDKIARMLANGDLIQLKKGQYVLGDEHRVTPVSLPLVANLLYGPSYVSLDFALSWHGLIPEGVFEVSSVTTRRARRYDTPLGRFSYTRTFADLYGVGIMMERNPDGSHFLIASPEKALCDKVLFTRNLHATTTRTMHVFLEDDLRIDFDVLSELNLEPVRQCVATGHKPRQLRALCKVLEGLQ